MTDYLYYNRRAFFYSAIIVLGLMFLMNIELFNTSFYIASAIVLYLIILFEMYYIWFVSREKLKQLDLPLITEYSKSKEFLNHILLPSLLYFALAGFIYYNNQTAIRVPLIIISFIAFSSLFVNLKAFYLDKADLEKNTYFVYDLIELMIFFMLTNLSLHYISIRNLPNELITLSTFVISFGMLLLNLFQLDRIHLIEIGIAFGLSFIPAFSALFLGVFNSYSILAISAYTFLSYYFSFGFLVHKVDGTLNKEVVLEYISIFLLALAFLFGIS